MSWTFRLLRALSLCEMRTAIAIAAFGEWWAERAFQRACKRAANLHAETRE